MAQRTRISFSTPNTDEALLEVLDVTKQYLASHQDIFNEIEEQIWAYRSLLDLVPETTENFISGHIFPLLEGGYELDSSIAFCRLGFYKHAIGALRNVLELGWLSVYWDLGNRSHVDIQGWFRSVETTPFRNSVFKKLKANDNFKTFDDKHALLNGTEKTYETLCNFAHTRGARFSSRQLTRSNLNNFNERSFKKWLSLMKQVVADVAVFHILKYPIGFQEIPIDEKFGLNSPMGGFLAPWQVERFKRLLPANVVATLQEISDNDPDVRKVAESINAMPDITEEEWRRQIEDQDKLMIQMEGFENWRVNEEQFVESMKEDLPDACMRRLAHIEEMRQWAEENGFMKPPSRSAPNS